LALPQNKTIGGRKAVAQIGSFKTAPSRRQVVKGGAALLAGIASPAILSVRPALAAYPDRPVKLLVPNSPGGISDIVARLLAVSLQQAMGSSFAIENKGGAGGNIGMASVARSDPDGYTLLITTSAFAVNPGLYNSLPFDPFKDFVAIAELTTSPNVFAVKPELGVKTMKELVALARANPDKFNISTPPISTTPYLASELFKVRESLPKVATVAFTGGGDAFKALLTGTVQLSLGALGTAHPHIASGAVTGLATTGTSRWHDLPNMPTMAEAGFKDFVMENYVGLMAPANTPPDIVARLERETLTILNKPDIRTKLIQSGFKVEAKPGKDHSARIAKEVPMYRDIVTQAGIKKL
jgi:tripartite-type tricarboxylate transporter receptor subunit TctC